jgi:hypothetical protein
MSACAATVGAFAATAPRRSQGRSRTLRSRRNRFTLPERSVVVTSSPPLASVAGAIQTGTDTASPERRYVVRETNSSWAESARETTAGAWQVPVGDLGAYLERALSTTRSLDAPAAGASQLRANTGRPNGRKQKRGDVAWQLPDRRRSSREPTASASLRSRRRAAVPPAARPPGQASGRSWMQPSHCGPSDCRMAWKGTARSSVASSRGAQAGGPVPGAEPAPLPAQTLGLTTEGNACASRSTGKRFEGSTWPLLGHESASAGALAGRRAPPPPPPPGPRSTNPHRLPLGTAPPRPLAMEDRLPYRAQRDPRAPNRVTARVLSGPES